MNMINVKEFTAGTNNVMRCLSDDTVLWQWSIDNVPVNSDFEIISGAFVSDYVTRGKAATFHISVVKNFNPSGVVLIDDRGIIRKEFTKFNVNTRATDRDRVTIVFTAFESDVGNRTYTAYILDGDGKRSANSISETIEVR